MPRHKRGMTDGEKPEEGPTPKKKRAGSGKRKAKKQNPNKSRNGAKSPRARARDLDRSAAEKVRSVWEIQRDAKKALLLERLEEKGEEISVAARALGIGKTALWEWRKNDPDFEADLEAAYKLGTDTISEVIRCRAIDGYDETVFHQGKQYTVRKYDHALLLALARKREPAYRDPKYAAPVIAPKLPGEVSLDLDKMPPELLAQLEAEARRQAAEKAAAQ